MADEAFYVPVTGSARTAEMAPAGWEVFSPTRSTVSLWGPDMQHGSPPSALLVRAMENCDPRPGTRLSRVVVEILGPVPVSENRVRAWVQRPGRNIELLCAELVAAGPDGTFRPVASASAWRLTTADTADVARAFDPPMPPLDAPAAPGFGVGWDEQADTYLDAVEWHWVTSPGGTAPGRAWGRSKRALVAGEPMTPLQNLFAIVDVANGVGAKVDVREWTFLNTDLTVHVHRVPAGEWIGVAAEMSIGPDGIGMTAGVAYDVDGPVARTAQTVLVRPR